VTYKLASRSFTSSRTGGGFSATDLMNISTRPRDTTLCTVLRISASCSPHPRGTASFELEKSLVERPHFGNHPSAVMLGDRPARTRSCFSSICAPLPPRFFHTLAIERERPRCHRLHRVIFHHTNPRRRAHLRSQPR